MLVFCSAQKGKKNDERKGVINQRKWSLMVTTVRNRSVVKLKENSNDAKWELN